MSILEDKPDMAENPMFISCNYEHDENFYESTSPECLFKSDFSSQLKTNYPQSFTSNLNDFNIMGSHSDDVNFLSIANNTYDVLYNDGPCNDHTYNLNENRIKYNINDYKCTDITYNSQNFNDSQLLKIEDDVFQVDKDDLIQGPTLAELNADSSLLDIDPLEFDDIILPNEKISMISKIKPMLTSESSCFNTSTSVANNLDFSKVSSNCHLKVSDEDVKPKVLNEFADVKVLNEYQNVMLKSMLSMNAGNDNEKSSDAALSVLPMWSAVPKSTESTVPAITIKEEFDPPLRRRRTLTEDSNDEGFDSDSDVSDHEDSYLMDNDSRSNDRYKHQDKYFWQYNLQSKGPKTHTITLADKLEDPHFLQSITDPVFNPECQVIVKGIKHTGKARKGDGNDLNPSPTKLNSIGKELKRLNHNINELSANDGNVTARSSSRKEKNKLASRICRLKKKAQHEANKIKLYALQEEHKRYINCISEIKTMLLKGIEADSSEKPILEKLEDLCTSQIKPTETAGRTTEFVNDILENIALGVPQGGIYTH